MAKIVNLNKARKSKERIEAKKRAEGNSVRFGRSTAEKQQDEASRQAFQTHIDGHKRDTPDEPE